MNFIHRFIRPASIRMQTEEIEHHTTWLEIFFDLVFGVMILKLSERLLNQLSVMGILQCVGLFIPIMWTWASYTVFSARFDNNDIFHWLMTFVIMFSGAIMAIQIPVALETGGEGFSVGFIIGQIAILLLYSRTIYSNLKHKHIKTLYISGFGLAGTCWLISLFFAPPTKFILWLTGMCIYLIIPWIGRKKILLYAPLDTIYIPERFGAFTIIILGQIIASVVLGLESSHWNLASLFTGLMTFTLAILIWGQYYFFTQKANYKCTLGSGQPYIYTHIPLITSLLIIGVCSEEYIKNPTKVLENVNNIFCFALILYLTSFYFLQYISMRKFKIRGFAYLAGILSIVFLFYFYTLSSMINILVIVLIFTTLFGIQFWVRQHV